jgi:hypothetical protein
MRVARRRGVDPRAQLTSWRAEEPFPRKESSVNDLFSPAGSFGVVGLSILVSMVGYKAFASPALLADPARRDWLHAFAAAVLSTAAIAVVLLAATLGGGSLLSALGTALLAQVVIVGTVYRSVVAGVVLVMASQLVGVVLAIAVLVHPVAPAVFVTAWGFWLLERDRVPRAHRPF